MWVTAYVGDFMIVTVIWGEWQNHCIGTFFPYADCKNFNQHQPSLISVISIYVEFADCSTQNSITNETVFKPGSGDSDVGDWMLVTICGCRWLWTSMLMLSFECWPDANVRQCRCWWPKWPKPSPTSSNCHPYILSPTSVTNIDVTPRSWLLNNQIL